LRGLVSGGYIDISDSKQAVDDHATANIYHEGWPAKLRLVAAAGLRVQWRHGHDTAKPVSFCGVLCKKWRLIMQIPVLVERVKGNGYRARGTEPFAVSARGATREEALAKLRAKIQTQLKKGRELVSLEIGQDSDPWMEFAGMFKADPWIDDWKRSVEEYRQKVENDPDAP
jgi:predicted RNase H-like HicB family nuclease